MFDSIDFGVIDTGVSAQLIAGCFGDDSNWPFPQRRFSREF
jgi:hypothetical protein